MHSPNLPSDRQSLDPILWTAFATCLVCVFALGLAFRTTTTSTHSQSQAERTNSDPVYFPPFSVDHGRLKRERSEQQSEAQLGSVDHELSKLYSIVRRANLAQFPQQDGQDRIDPVILNAEVTFAADEVLPASGVRGFTAVGEPIFAACNQGIEELLKAIRLKSISIEDAQQNPPSSRFKKYRENCGNALSMLLQHGLVTANGQWTKPYSSTLFDILNRFRWAHIAHSRLPARLQLAPYEYELLMRWRIEDPDAFSITERRNFLAQAASEIHDYDATLAKALLDNEQTDRSQAIERLRELSENHPTNQAYSLRYQRALQYTEPE